MIDYAACVRKAYPTITDSEFSLSEEDGVTTLTWNRGDAKPTLASLEAQWLAVVKGQAIIEIKDIRRQGLDKATISSGVLAIYNTNYEAAVDFLNGNPDNPLKNGMTPVEYLTGFGARLGMSATQFANYIVAENLRVGPTVYDIEHRYLALAYGGDAANGIVPINYLPSEAAVQQSVANFKTYCGV